MKKKAPGAYGLDWAPILVFREPPAPRDLKRCSIYYKYWLPCLEAKTLNFVVNPVVNFVLYGPWGHKRRWPRSERVDGYMSR